MTATLERLIGDGTAGLLVLESSRSSVATILPGPGKALVKEVIHAGETWVHPLSGERVEFTEAELRAIALSTNAFIDVQGPIPFPDGHTTLASRNLGFWHHFFVEDGVLYGLVEPGDANVKARLGTTIRAVSLFLEGKVKDSKGGEHRMVLTHVCATNYPVATGQQNFVALSRGGVETKVPVFRPADSGGKTAMNKTIAALAAMLALSAENKTEEVLGGEVEAEVKKLQSAATTQGAVALAAKGEVTSLATKVTSLEAQLSEHKAAAAKQREEAFEAIALSAKSACIAAGVPLDKADEDIARNHWKAGDDASAKRVLELAVKASGGRPLALDAATAQRPAAGAPAGQGLALERETVKEVVSALERGGIKVEMSKDGLSYRCDGEAHWRFAKV